VKVPADSKVNKEFTGDLLADFSAYFRRGFFLAVMPVSRVHLDSPIQYKHGLVFYPPGWAELKTLNVAVNRTDTRSHAELASAASGIDVDLLETHPLVAFPCMFNCEEFQHGNHQDHCECIRTMSAYVDRVCFNILKFNRCELGLPDTIPGRVGSIIPNPMMAGALLYSHEHRRGRIVGGSAFSHAVVKGLGLPLVPLNTRHFPRSGEVGRIVSHALELFSAALEASTPTLQFVQAISLLEFLADPFEYQSFKNVKKIIARYAAKDALQYDRLLDRFHELTGKKADSGEILGYRTRIVHMGQRLEEIFPVPADRRNVLQELQSYARAVITHMIVRSNESWSDYLELRAELQSFQTASKMK
jgi:hypothetical protein